MICERNLLTSRSAALLLRRFDASVSSTEAERAAEMLAMACADPLDFWIDVLPVVNMRLQLNITRTLSHFKAFNVTNATGKCAFVRARALFGSTCNGGSLLLLGKRNYQGADACWNMLEQRFSVPTGVRLASACRYRLDCSDRVQRSVLLRLQELACIELMHRGQPSKQGTAGSGAQAGGHVNVAWRNVCVDGTPVPPVLLHPLACLLVPRQGVVTMDYVASAVRFDFQRV